jgi:hypothetical protein
MSEYDKEEKSKVIIRGLLSLGLDVDSGAKHDRAKCPETRQKTTIPPHKKLNKFVVGSICDFLIINGYSPEQIRSAFGWK